jgi:hypothetical protein
MSTTSSPLERYTPSIFNTSFASLPNPKRVWVGAPGSEEEGLGRLNLLTPEIVCAAARSEIRLGRRVGLSWDMRKLEYSQYGRQKFQHDILPISGPPGSGLGACFDDAYSMNPRKFSGVYLAVGAMRTCREEGARVSRDSLIQGLVR